LPVAKARCMRHHTAVAAGDGGELSDAAAGPEWSQAGWFARKAVWCGGGLADILALWRQCREVAGGRRAWPGAVGGPG